jgi:WD40 repeat protein
MKKLLLFSTLVLVCQFTFAQPTYEILASSRGTNSVKQYDINGNYVGDFVANGSGGLATTEDILFHPNGTVLVTGYNNTTIKQYDGISGNYIGDFTGGYPLSNPSKMSIGPDSLIYVTQWGATQNKVARFDLGGAFVDEFTSINVSNGLGHVWDAGRNFYIAVFGTGADGTVHKFDSLGNDLGTFINSVVLQGPTSIWWDANGDMLVEDWTVGNVLRYDTTGQYLGVFLTGMNSPEGIAFKPNGNMLIGDWGQDAIHEFDSAGNNLGYFTNAGGLTDPNSVKIRVSPTLSVSDYTNSVNDFVVFPTASSESFTISITLEAETELHLDVIDHIGKQIKLIHNTFVSEGVHQWMWNPDSGVASGNYFVRVTANDASISKKLIVLD